MITKLEKPLWQINQDDPHRCRTGEDDSSEHLDVTHRLLQSVGLHGRYERKNKANEGQAVHDHMHQLLTTPASSGGLLNCWWALVRHLLVSTQQLT